MIELVSAEEKMEKGKILLSLDNKTIYTSPGRRLDINSSSCMPSTVISIPSFMGNIEKTAAPTSRLAFHLHTVGKLTGCSRDTGDPKKAETLGADPIAAITRMALAGMAP